MGSDHKVQVDMEGGSCAPAEVTVVREAPSAGARWRMGGALLAMALCVSAALFFTGHHQKQDGVEEADDLRHTLRQVSTSGDIKAAIHLEVNNSETSRGDAVQWHDGVDQAFVRGDLRLVDNEIVIPESGLYFVYSQVSFKVDCSARKTVRLSQTIKRHSDSTGAGYYALLHSTRTTCESPAPSKGRSYNSVYAGAAFHLSAGDRLKTEVTNVKSLDSSAGKNFFGVFAL